MSPLSLYINIKGNTKCSSDYRKAIQLAHYGKCAPLLEPEQCPKECEADEVQPTCASDGNVYRHVILLKQYIFFF